MKPFTKRTTLLITLTFILTLFSQIGWGQVTTIDFETAGSGYTPSGTEGTGFTDIFNRTNYNMTACSNEDGYYWAVEDLNLSNPSITLDQIDVTGSTSFTFAIDMVAHHYNDWDDNDELLITYSIDGGAYQNLMWVQNTGEQYNDPAALDTDFDGDGECANKLPALSTGTGTGGCVISSSDFATFTTSSIALSGNSTLDIILQFNGLTSGDEGIYIDNIIITETGGSSNDTDSEALAPASQLGGGTISSLDDTQAEAVNVFKFDIDDQGTADGLVTHVTNIRIKPHSTNTADWTDHIQGLTLNNGSAITIGAPTITDTYIDIPITSGNLDVTDGGSTTITMAVYLNTSNIVDGGVLSFMVDANPNGFTADNSGSTFATTFSGGDFNSADFTITVVATELQFVQVPTSTTVNVAMSPDPTVKACDENGNVDTDYSTAISVSSDGTMTGDPVSGTWSLGVASFAGLTHTVEQTGRTLTATSGAMNVASTNFDITAVSSTCGTETFTNSNATSSYATSSYTGDNSVTWNYVESRDDAGYQITGTGLMLRRSSDNSKVYSGTVTGGIGDFTCKLKKGFTGAGNRQVELFVNGVSQGTSIAWDNTTVQTFSVSGINISGNVTVEIRNIRAYQVVVDDIDWTCYGSSNDTDSEASAPASQQAGGNISSLDDTAPEAVDVFKFDIDDQGTADGLPTHVTNIRIKPAANNTADWTDNIQGIILNDGTSDITVATTTITDTYIDLAITSGNLDVTDGGTVNLTMSVFLNTSNITDGGTLAFFIDYDNHGFTADVSGSTFASSFGSADITSNDFIITVVATELRYAQQPTDTNTNTCMSPDVAVEATDANGNRDTDFSSDISITSTGTLSSSPVVVTAISGLATFSGANCIDHTLVGTNLTLNAERGNPDNDWDVVSDQFTITDINACGLEEFDDGTTAPAGWTFTNIGGTYTTATNYGNSSPALKMDATGDIVETATVTSPSQLTFWYKGQGTSDGSASLLVEGWDGSWNTIENITNLLTTGTTKTYNSGLSSYSKFRFSYTKSSGNLAFDDVNVTCGSCDEPTSDATNLTFPTINSTSLDLTWDNGNGGNRIVVCRQGAAVSFTPTDASTYAANSDYSAGVEVGPAGEGNKVVYNGSASSLTVTGLTPGTTYYFEIYEYGCSAGAEDYYTTGTPAEGNETTLPENVGNFTLTCITNTTATLTWNLPTGGFDGILIAVRESTLTPSDPSCDGSTLSSPDTDFSSALVYCGNSTTSKYVYNATGTTVTITGLTPAADYVFKAFTYNGSTWTSGTQTSEAASLQNVTNESTSPADQQVTVRWTNPTTCYDEIMVVAHSGGSVTQTPSGDGSAYIANAVFGSGTNLGTNDYVVYKGTNTSVDVTNVNNGTQYCFKIFTRKDSEWSSGVEICEIPADVTIFQPGELIIVGFDSNVGGGTDSIFITSLVDIKPGTEFLYVNSRFEAGAAANTRTYEWHGGGDDPDADPGIFKISYSSSAAANIPAGSIIAFSTNGDHAQYFDVDGTSNADFSSTNVSGSANIHATAGDQIWLIQGDFTDQGNFHSLYGNCLWGISNRVAWVPISNAVSNNSDGTGRESRLHPDLECFNLELSSGEGFAFYENQANHNDTKRNLLLAIMGTGNWQDGTGDATMNFDADYTNPYSNDQVGKPFVITAGNTDGTWVGGASGNVDDWFDCRNWEGLTVPDENVNVTIPNVTDSPDIDNSSSHAAKYNNYAECNDLDINNETLSINGAVNDTLFVHGNLLIQSSGVLDMDDGTGTRDGIIYLTGNWDNQATFNEGDGTVVFNGSDAQTISVAGKGTETYNNLRINNINLTGVTTNDNIVVNDTLSQVNSLLNLNTWNIELKGVYENTNSYFEGDAASNFIISSDADNGDIDSIYFKNDLSVNDFTIDRTGKSAVLMTDLDVTNNMTITAGNITFTVGNNYDVAGTLTNTPATADALIIRSDASGTASLIQNIGAVPATVERYLSGDNWHYIFAPLHQIDTTTFTIVSWGDRNPNLFWYNEPIADYWNGLTIYNPTGWTGVNGVVPATQYLKTDRGYIHYFTYDKVFSQTGGNLDVSDKVFTVSITDNSAAAHPNYVAPPAWPGWDKFDAWNLIGNPYVSAIDWDAIPAGNKANIEGFIYYYDDTQDKYLCYGGAPAWNNNGITINGGNQYIPAGQSIMVKATANGNLTIPENVRLHNSQAFYKKNNKDIIPDLLRFQIEKDNYYDETVIRTIVDATDDHDAQYDAYKMFAWSNDKPQIYTNTNVNSVLFAVNTIPEINSQKTIPVEVRIEEAGDYTIKFTENNFDNMHIWFEDVLLNETLNVLNNDSYSFSQASENNEDRFFVHFGLNTKPQVNIEIPDQETEVNEYYSFDLPENVFIDNDFEDVLTISASLASGEELPAWLTFDSDLMQFSGTPGEVQSIDIKLTATDIFGEEISDIFNLNVKNSVSVSVLEEQSVFVYPNPTSDIITVQISGNNVKANIKIENINGKVILNKSINSNSADINLSEYAAGIYIVEVEINNNIIRKRIVKK